MRPAIEQLQTDLRNLADYAADGPESPMVTDMVALMRKAADELDALLSAETPQEGGDATSAEGDQSFDPGCASTTRGDRVDHHAVPAAETPQAWQSTETAPKDLCRCEYDGWGTRLVACALHPAPGNLKPTPHPAAASGVPLEEKIPEGAYAVRALETAATMDPDAMLRVADIIEREYAVCEAQWLRGIALRQARAAETPQAWQSIETAPRDSTRILVYCPSEMQPAREVFEAWWRMPWESAPAEQCYWCFDDNKTMLDASVHGLGATHWMPIPAVPSSQAAETPQEKA